VAPGTVSPAPPWAQAIRVLPPDLRQRIERLPPHTLDQMEELRLRLGKPVQLYGSRVDGYLAAAGGLTHDTHTAVMLEERTLAAVVQAITQASLYAVEEELRRGFVTIAGGHRVGVAGRVVLDGSGHVRTLRRITSVNLRIARECRGAADSLRNHLADSVTGRPLSVLVLSPPGCGKTTLLRDIARQWSQGTFGRAVKVGVVDERSEIAGAVDGVPQFDIGPRTDVLDGCPKAEGMLMMIRSLSPQLLVTDEIGRSADCDALLEASHAGVAVVASAHASSLEEWCTRPHMRPLFESRSFDRYVLLSRRKGPGTVERVFDEHGRPLSGL
jgi:stage III sporulation protein AA